MIPLWQRQALNPANLESLWLLDAAFHLKFVAYRDVVLREQLREAWQWVLKNPKNPTSTLALRSNEYALGFGAATPKALPGLKEAP